MSYKNAPPDQLRRGVFFVCCEPRLFSDLSIPIDNKFGGSQILKPHRPEGVQLGGGDADFRSQAKLAAVGETGRSVDHDAR